MGFYLFNQDGAPVDRWTDVSADAGRAGSGDAGVGAVGEAAPNALPKAPSPASGPAMLQFRRETIRRRWRRVAAPARPAPPSSAGATSLRAWPGRNPCGRFAARLR